MASKTDRNTQRAEAAENREFMLKRNAKMAAKKRKKQIKIAIISVVVVVAVILAFVFVPKLLKNDNTMPVSVTTYNVESITYGDVDTTISGSGTLTPITKETLMLDDEEWQADEEENTDESSSDESSDESVEPETAAMGQETTPQEPVELTVYTISAINYTAGNSVEEGAVIATLTDEDSVVYEYTAPYACVILDMTLAVGDELSNGSTIATVMGMDGFTMGIAVDEYDIDTVKVGQEVTFTVNALNGDYTGSITNVSYSGSSSGSSSAYQITAMMDYVEGIYPGMSVSAEIVIESSGEGLLVPADAIHTSGDDSFIYLAPSGASEGTEYAEGELDLSTLSKVTVETGMSDGSYILIESSELYEGDLIIITKLTATQTGSDSENNGGMGSFGGMGGGRFPGGEGMDFGDFDFENFDPGNMPGGFGGFGG